MRSALSPARSDEAFFGYRRHGCRDQSCLGGLVPSNSKNTGV
jgi:hypothetical protein